MIIPIRQRFQQINGILQQRSLSETKIALYSRTQREIVLLQVPQPVCKAVRNECQPPNPLFLSLSGNGGNVVQLDVIAAIVPPKQICCIVTTAISFQKAQQGQGVGFHDLR